MTTTCIGCVRLTRHPAPYTGMTIDCPTCDKPWIYDTNHWILCYELGTRKVAKLQRIGVVDQIIRREQEADA